MKINITYRNMNRESYESTRVAIEQTVERHLAPRLAAFDVGHLELHATVEHTSTHSYCVTYRLHLPPKKILVAKECNDNIRTAIQEVTSELTRQAKRHRAHISGQQHWNRKGRRQRLQKLYQDISNLEPEVKQSVEQSITPLQPRLEHFIKHELAYLRANGDLLPDYPRLADIRDEAVARLHIDWKDLKGSDETLYRKLLREVTQIINQEIEQTRVTSEQLSLDDTLSPDAIDQAEAMIEEDQGEFYQPDEVLHIQDLIPDTHARSPELNIDGYHDHFYRYLGGLPIQWRRTVLLVHREGLSTEEVARHILSTTPEEVEQMIDLADAYMYERMKDAGFEAPRKKTIKLLLQQ